MWRAIKFSTYKSMIYFLYSGGILMKMVETPWKGLYKAFLFVFGIPFSILGIIFFLIDGSWAFLLNGFIWIAFGIGVKLKSLKQIHKLEKLKSEGRVIKGSIVRIIPAHWVKIGSYVTAQLECVYETEEGEKTVKSGYFLLSPFDRLENLVANIYVDYRNVSSHIVEIYRVDNSTV